MKPWFCHSLIEPAINLKIIEVVDSKALKSRGRRVVYIYIHHAGQLVDNMLIIFLIANLLSD